MSSEAFYVEASKHLEAVLEDRTYVGLQAILLCCYYSLLNPTRGSTSILLAKINARSFISYAIQVFGISSDWRRAVLWIMAFTMKQMLRELCHPSKST